MPQSRLDAALSSRMLRRQTTVPARRVQAAQLAERAEHVDPAIVIGRRRARAVAAHRLDELAVPAVGPQLAAGFDVVRRRHFLAAPLLDREGAAVGHDERGVAEADRLLPQPRQPVGRPLGAEWLRGCGRRARGRGSRATPPTTAAVAASRRSGSIRASPAAAWRVRIPSPAVLRQLEAPAPRLADARDRPRARRSRDCSRRTAASCRCRRARRETRRRRARRRRSRRSRSRRQPFSPFAQYTSSSKNH